MHTNSEFGVYVGSQTFLKGSFGLRCQTEFFSFVPRKSFNCGTIHAIKPLFFLFLSFFPSLLLSLFLSLSLSFFFHSFSFISFFLLLSVSSLPPFLPLCLSSFLSLFFSFFCFSLEQNTSSVLPLHLWCKVKTLYS